MKVWYCEEHRVVQPPDRTETPPTWCWLWSLRDQPGPPPCRLVPMRLIPDNEEPELEAGSWGLSNIPAETVEGGCERCRGPNIVSWFVDSALWNLATDNERHLMLCPQCFTEAWAKQTGLGDKMVWELRLDLPK